MSDTQIENKTTSNAEYISNNITDNEKKEIMLLNWFVTSTLSMLGLLQESMKTAIEDGPFIDDEDLDESEDSEDSDKDNSNEDNKDKSKEEKMFYELDLDDISLKQVEPLDLSLTQKNNYEKFMKASNLLITNLKGDFDDYGSLIKKAFKVLQTNNSTKLLLEEDFGLFKQRDSDNKYITIIKGIDIRFGCKFLTNTRDKALFWRYMNLYCVSIFRLIEFSNENKIKKYPNVKLTTLELERRLSKTGLMFGDQFFNPFIGIHELGGKYTIDDLYQNVGSNEMKGGFNINLILKTLGIDKVISSKQLKEELKKFDKEHIDMATDTISNLLGDNDEDSKKVYGTVLKSMIKGLKKDGLENPDKVLNRVNKVVSKNVSKDRMQKMMSNIGNFMENSEDKLKNLKDKDGNPIGEDIMKKMKGPMESFKGMNPKDMKNPFAMLNNLKGMMNKLGLDKKLKEAQNKK